MKDVLYKLEWLFKIIVCYTLDFYVFSAVIMSLYMAIHKKDAEFLILPISLACILIVIHIFRCVLIKKKIFKGKIKRKHTATSALVMYLALAVFLLAFQLCYTVKRPSADKVNQAVIFIEKEMNIDNAKLMQIMPTYVIEPVLLTVEIIEEVCVTAKELAVYTDKEILTDEEKQEFSKFLTAKKDYLAEVQEQIIRKKHSTLVTVILVEVLIMLGGIIYESSIRAKQQV